MDLAEAGKINLVVNCEVVGIDGDGKLENVTVKHKSEGEKVIETDHWVLCLD